MSRVVILYRRYREVIFRLFLFIITVSILVYFLPSERKFAFEYQKGTPWMHEDLIAPFDFAIKKTERNIKKEKDSIESKSIVYYRFDEQKYNNLDSIFNKTVDSVFENYGNTVRLSKKHRSDLNNIVDSIKIDYSQILYNGIVDSVVAKSFKKANVALVRNNIVYRADSGLLDLSKANVLIINKTLSLVGNSQLYRNFIEKIPFNNLQITALYDAETTTKMKKRQLSSLSITAGMIQKGQRIISRGDLITTNQYQVLESLRERYESTSEVNGVRKWILYGKIIVVSFSVAILFLFLIYFRKEIMQHRIKSYFIVLMLLLMVFAIGIRLHFASINLYAIPIIILPIIIRIFYDARLAIFVNMVALLIIGFIVPNPFEFVFIQFLVGVIAIMSLRQMRRRQQIFITAVAILASYSLIYVGLTIMKSGDITKIDPYQFVWFAVNSMLVLWSYPLIYLFEKLFGFLSDVTLMELADTNHPLLRKLNEKAPGTFQHVMQVANLSEAVIRRIGGSPSLVRTGALYHDIGKMESPEYFIENQVVGQNPHDKLSFTKSAQVIINHVTAGLKIAKQYSLPKPVVDFIRTHHGDGLVRYFYVSEINVNSDKFIDRTAFQYPGPVPFSKETGVVMMADAVEAASRSLKVITEKTIDELVDNIVNYIITEDQLRNADITFKDISITKNILKEKLKNIYHTRIEYPE